MRKMAVMRPDDRASKEMYKHGHGMRGRVPWRMGPGPGAPVMKLKC